MSDNLLKLADELVEVGRLVSGDDVTSALARFVKRVVSTVPECDEAMIAVQAVGASEIVAQEHRLAGQFDEAARSELHMRLVDEEGPMYEALRFAEPRRIGDFAAERRWPRFGAAVLNAGHRSCLFFPLASTGAQTAVFGLFSATPGAFSDVSYDLVLLFALHAGVAFDNVRLYDDSSKLIEQLRTALDTRTVISQAQGLLMQRFGIASTVAFDVLKRRSQDTNTRLRALAENLVESHHHGDLDQELRRLGLSSLAG
ncbi:GAF and ANTAR domain-containing protein [Kribbella sp. NPDC056861]|uniref:GAF and ANTAR domain-containing protein n=1 Tax=Kribbella sp. NPDC056861 TaxID=3154857 RepID=UPI003429C3F3